MGILEEARMTNKNVAKTVVATGAAVVVLTMAAPLVVTLPLCAGLGWYFEKLFSEKDDEGDKKRKNKRD